VFRANLEDHWEYFGAGLINNEWDTKCSILIVPPTRSKLQSIHQYGQNLVLGKRGG
jgi:hypothetical protein